MTYGLVCFIIGNVSRTHPTAQLTREAIQTARKTTTSSEVKARWIRENYKSYRVNLRYDSDIEMINFVEENKGKDGTTPIFREALELLLKARGM